MLSMQPWPGRVLYAVKSDPPEEYSTSLITNNLYSALPAHFGIYAREYSTRFITNIM